MQSQSSLDGSIDMIGKLIAFPTVSRDSNLELIDFVREQLRDLDADVRLTFDDDRGKANLFATLGPPDLPAWSSPVIPMSCRLKDSGGRLTPLHSWRRRAASTVAARQT